MTPKQASVNKHAAQVAKTVHYQGVECKNGHPGLRYTRNNLCVYCQREIAARQIR